MTGANAKLSLQEAQHETTYLVFLYFRKQSSRGTSTPTQLPFMLDSVYPEILNTLNLSCKNVQARVSTWASMHCADYEEFSFRIFAR